MKRHTALIPLSREHLRALILSKNLQNGRSSNPKHPWPQERKAVLKKLRFFFEYDLLPHLEAEERFFFEALSQDTQLGALCQELLQEHTEFRAFYARLEHSTPEEWQDFGKTLERHVRKEERILFEAMPSVLSEPLLQARGQALRQAYAQRKPYHCIFTGDTVSISDIVS